MIADVVGGILDVVSRVFKVPAKLAAGLFSRLRSVQKSDGRAGGDSYHESCPNFNCIHNDIPFPSHIEGIPAMRLQGKCRGCRWNRFWTGFASLTCGLITRPSRVNRRPLDVAAGEGQECRPVRSGRVSSAVLAESDIAVDEGRFDGRVCRGSEVFLAEQFVNGPSSDCSEEHAFRVGPAVALNCASTDEDGARRAERDQLVSVDG